MKINKTFQAGAGLIHQTIYAQAGSIEKGYLEYIMNAVDAGATRIDINMNFNGINYEIIDNGNGFGSRDMSWEEKEKVIEFLFGQLGFDHGTKEENYRTYGKFGIGRAQMWAFSKNSWHTHNVKMNVDILNHGLNYEMEKTNDFFDGCKIQGEFYDHLTPNEINNIKKQLATLAAYAPIDVYFNGTKINRSMDDIKNQFDVEGVRIELKPSSSLKVYNQGVFVREYNNYFFGTGGIVCSEKGYDFELNAARNDILQSKCPLWKKIKTFLNTDMNKRTKKSLNDDLRKSILGKIASGEYKDEDGESYLDKNVIKLINNKYISLKKLLTGGNSFSFAYKNEDILAESIQNNTGTFVIKADFVNSISSLDHDDVFNILKKIVEDNYKRFTIDDLFKDLDILKSNYNQEHVAIPENKLNKRQKLFLEALNLHSVQSAFIPSTERNYYSCNNAIRKIRFGKSETANGWTDGVNNIFLNIELFDDIDRYGVKQIFKIIMIILHEYKHYEDNVSEHNIDFYKNFHDSLITSSGGYIFDAVISASKAYVERLVKNGFLIQKKLNRSIERLAFITNLDIKEDEDELENLEA